MTLRLRGALLAAVLLGLVVAGCREQLTAPGSCPATCPGGTPTVRDTILDALPGQDSSYVGYVIQGATQAGLRLSNNYLGNTDYGVIAFRSRPDTVAVRDTARTYTIDSVQISVTLLARDTSVSGVVLELHRAPATTDTTATYASISPVVVPGTLIDSVTIADTVRSGHTYKFLFKGAALSQVDIPPGDSGVLAIVAAISGATPTGARIGGAGSGGLLASPLLQTWVTLNVTDTTPTIKHQELRSIARFSRYVSSVTPVADPDLLTVGTAAGARSMIRFPFPAYLRDSALISRATLELTPADTIRGLVSDTANLDVESVVADFGPKSPNASLAGFRTLTFNSADTVRVEVGTELKNWQSKTLPHPPVFFLALSLEGASFTEPRFRSTRPGPGHPRLHVTYQLPFAFERP